MEFRVSKSEWWRGPVIQAVGSVLAAAIIAWGAVEAAARFDPKFVRVGDHVINIDHLVEIAQHDDGDGCTIIISISGSRFSDSLDGLSFAQHFAGHDVDRVSCEVLRDALNSYSIDGRPLFVPRSQAR